MIVASKFRRSDSTTHTVLIPIRMYCRNGIVHFMHTSCNYNRVQICETGNGKKWTATTTTTVQYVPIRWCRW